MTAHLKRAELVSRERQSAQGGGMKAKPKPKAKGKVKVADLKSTKKATNVRGGAYSSLLASKTVVKRPLADGPCYDSGFCL